MLYEAQVSIASTGTAVQLSTTRAAATWVQVQAVSTNNALGVSLGGSDVTLASSTKPGVIIAPGGTQFLPGDNVPSGYSLSSIWINGTTGDKVNVLYFRR
jgi:hypothetical protein